MPLLITTVSNEDTPLTIARKIFDHFLVDQSCMVTGIDENIIPKGEKVIEHIREFDNQFQHYVDANGKRRRKRITIPNTIGGYVSQKIFKFKQEVRNHKMIYTIWRIQ